jgi:ectoine hydroxylase-related dioxygenase (phytanoyl-CoA dioxygenase family)
MIKSTRAPRARDGDANIIEAMCTSSSSTQLSFVIPYSNKAAWKAHLDTEGFVVISDVLSREDVENGIEMFREWMARLLKKPKLRLEQLQDDEWFRGTYGMLMDGCIHRSPFVFWARSHPTVLEIYRDLYNLKTPEELVTAFDRANAVLNRKMPESKDPKDFDLERSLWTHVDYPLTGTPPPFTCYQSFVNFVDCTSPGSPCLRVVPRSHTGPIWAALQKYGVAKYGPNRNGGFFKIDCKETEGAIVVQRDLLDVLAPPGSLVMWKSGLVHDSRTTHIAPLPEHGPLRRLVVYVCHAPRYLLSEHERRVRVELFRAGQ